MVKLKKHWVSILMVVIVIIFMIPSYYAFMHSDQDILTINDNGSSVFLDAKSPDAQLKHYGVGIFKIVILKNEVFGSPLILKNIQYAAGEDFGINVKNCVIKTLVQQGKGHYVRALPPMFPLTFVNAKLECNGSEFPLIVNIPPISARTLEFEEGNGSLIAQSDLEFFVYLYSSKLQSQILKPQKMIL